MSDACARPQTGEISADRGRIVAFRRNLGGQLAQPLLTAGKKLESAMEMGQIKNFHFALDTGKDGANNPKPLGT
jgi:hypothetical protein